MRKTLTMLVVIGSVAAGSSAYAGGFLGDLLNQVLPGTGSSLDSLHSDLGKPVDHTLSGVASGNLNQADTSLQKSLDAAAAGKRSDPTIAQSNSCVTPRGLCDAPNSTLNGTTCYCVLGKDTVLGRIQ